MSTFPILPRSQWRALRKGTVQHVRVYENGVLVQEFDMPPAERTVYPTENIVRWCNCDSIQSHYVEDERHGHGWVCDECGGVQQLG